MKLSIIGIALQITFALCHKIPKILNRKVLEPGFSSNSIEKPSFQVNHLQDIDPARVWANAYLTDLIGERSKSWSFQPIIFNFVRFSVKSHKVY